MMDSDFLIKGGVLIDPRSPETIRKDLLVRAGRIERIGDALAGEGIPVYDASGKYVSPGWMDMHVHFRDPGYEHKETVKTGCAAAASGGFTAVACMPNTEPPIHTRDVVEYIIEQSRGTGVDVYPIACVSKNRAGETLAEMGDLVDAGAVAFSDDGSPVQHSGLMRRALEYALMLGRPIINHMEDLTLNANGHMHEGEVSTRLGISGITALAEEVMIARDMLISEHTGGHVHVAHISTEGAVELVRQAKRRGAPVTAEVCTHHFTLTDEAVAESDYATSTKMHPPLRCADDVAAVKQGLVDGTIDVICTDHAPHASFEKDVEFIAAPFGIVGLETSWGLTGREIIGPGLLSLHEALEKMIVAPREILRLDVPVIEEGRKAELTIFDVSSKWTFTSKHIRSKSRNTPFVGAELLGKAWATVNQGILTESPAI